MESAPAHNTVATDEADLVRRCQAGEKAAFEPIVKTYAGRAYGVAVMMLRSAEDARDASQEAFVKAWRNIRRFDPDTNFYPWFRTILRNVCISRLRKRKRRPTVPLPEGVLSSPHGKDPGLGMERGERKEALWRAILELPLHHREIIVMNHFQDMAYKEIAEALDIPLGTVMSRLYNARQALRKALAGEIE